MVLHAGDKLFPLVGLLATLAAPLHAQEPSASLPTEASSPVVAADGDVDGIYISPKPGLPFTARVDGTLWEKARDLSGPTTKRLLSMVARDSSGRIYVENRQAYTLPPLDTVAPLVETFPPLESAGPRSLWPDTRASVKMPMVNFYIEDPNAHTRTTCYAATRTCRIAALHEASGSPEKSSNELPQGSTTESVSLGARKIEGLEVVGTRETTTIGAGVEGNPKAMVTVREVWYSPELELDISIKTVNPSTGTLTHMMKDLKREEPDRTYFAVPEDFKVLDNRSLATHTPQSSEVGKNEQDDSADAKPYLDQPLEQLIRLIPELKKLQPTADQQLLPLILQKSGMVVDDFVHNIVDIIAREKITQERLSAAGRVVASESVQDDYLILRSGEDLREALVEYRMDAKGNRLDQVGLYKGYAFTSGFALNCLYFATARQSDSTFRYLGQETIGKRTSYVVAFAQIPRHAKLTVAASGRPEDIHIQAQGIAWLDESTFQIIRMRTDLLDPPRDVDLDRETTEVNFSEVRFKDLATPLWLPRDVKVYLNVSRANRSCGCDTRRPPRVRYFRNEHHYTDYRRYRVSVKMGHPIR